MNRKFQYKAFISYSHKDKAVAEWLHRALETLKVPRYLVGQDTAGGPVPGHLRPIFRDESELAVSANLSKSVTDAVAESEFLIVICSPNSVASADSMGNRESWRSLSTENHSARRTIIRKMNASHRHCASVCLPTVRSELKSLNRWPRTFGRRQEANGPRC